MNARPEHQECVRRHLRIGWWSLLFFLTLGMVLETLHAFKIGWYLNVSNETRRLMFSLAHAHGTLFSLIHIAFAATLAMVECKPGNWPRTASAFLSCATVLLPGGFLLGGVYIYGGDPGHGVYLVPLGAFSLLFAVLITAGNIGAATNTQGSDETGGG